MLPDCCPACKTTFSVALLDLIRKAGGAGVWYCPTCKAELDGKAILKCEKNAQTQYPASLGARNELRIYGFPCELIVVRDDRTPRERLSITHALRFDPVSGRVELDLDAVRSKLDEFMVRPNDEPAVVNPAEVSVFERMFVERRSKRAA